jgi:general secretion pathway protein F
MPFAGLTLSDIDALSAEIRALAAAGLPLEKHLGDAGRGRGRRVEALTKEISQRLESGEQIDHIVSQYKSVPGRMLAATLVAGIRSGDLATSVELLGDLSADLVEVRSQLMRAMVYPIAICVLAGALFLFSIRLFLRRVFEMLVDLGSDIPSVFYWMYAADQRYPAWPWILPCALIVVLVIWMLDGRNGQAAFRGPGRILLLIPGVSALLRDIRFYTLTRMLCLLIERQLPLPDALMISGCCVGDSHLEQACRTEVIATRRGNHSALPTGVWRRGQLPPLLHACLAHKAANERVFADRLRGVAGHYQGRIWLSLSWLQHVIPPLLLVAIGGSTVAIYGLVLMYPVGELYRSLMTF